MPTQLASTPLDILQTTFGYPSFRLHQEEIIKTVLNREDAFVLMPTGGGKSLCYQIPALLFDGLTVVISPLIALMKDQVDALRVNGIKAAYLNSTLEEDERERVLTALRRNELKLLYVAPERLFSGSEAGSFIRFLQGLRIALFAIDEAHCISEWGHDFRPEYRSLAALKTLFPGVPTLALTATADRLTARDITEKLSLRQPRSFISSFNRPNIRYYIQPKQQTYQHVVGYLSQHRDDAGIIYTLSRNSAEKLARDLVEDGFAARPYHAGLDQRVRARNQELFLKDDIKIIVATIAFGMGINKSNVRFVIHVDLPKNIESYYQETGRAGRDGLPSESILFYSSADVFKLRRFAQIEDNPEQSRVMLRKLSQLTDLCEAQRCRRQQMLQYFGEETPSNCANCDICLTEVERFDGTIIAQKALSAVARLQSTYGLNYVIDFLRGSAAEKIKEHHRALPTYGTGKETSKADWYRFCKELIAQGHLRQTDDTYPVIKLTPSSPAVLNGSTKIFFAKPILAPTTVSATTPTSAISSKLDRSRRDTPRDPSLFQALKSLRITIARRENVPAYIIFSDATLVELTNRLPTNLEEIRTVSGFGDIKTERYGQIFLEALRQANTPTSP